MAYDIFISYRREGGLEYARPIKAELEKRGYRVFLDFDELKDGVFDRRIMDAIDAAPIFMIIVSEHSLERCLNANDWVRKEIEYAIAKQKHFIPINPDYQFKGYPEGFPEFLKIGLGQHQFSDIVLSQLFVESVNKMVADRIEPFLARTNRPAVQEETVGAIIHIETDMDCRVLKFGKEIAIAYAGKDNTVRLRKGKHKLEFVSLENEADHALSVPSPFIVEDNDYEDILTVRLQPVKSAREKIEKLILLPTMKDNKYGFVDKNGNTVISFKYDAAQRFSEGLARVRQHGKYGFIDKTGKEIIPFTYDDVDHFSEGLARVRQHGKYGFIDKTGKEIIPFTYDDVDHFSEGLARVKQKEKYGYIDKTGKEIIPFIYDYAGQFSEGLAPVGQKGKWGHIDKTGKTIIPFIYDYAGQFSEGLAPVRQKGKCGYIDKTGKTIIPFIYDYAGLFSEGLAPVKQKGKYGYIDKTGKTVIPFIYDYAGPFSEGLAQIRQTETSGYIDKVGKTITPIIYNYASNFFDGFAIVSLHGKYGYIDKTGKWVMEDDK